MGHPGVAPPELVEPSHGLGPVRPPTVGGRGRLRGAIERGRQLHHELLTSLDLQDRVVDLALKLLQVRLQLIRDLGPARTRTSEHQDHAHQDRENRIASSHHSLGPGTIRTGRRRCRLPSHYYGPHAPRECMEERVEDQERILAIHRHSEVGSSGAIVFSARISEVFPSRHLAVSHNSSETNPVGS